MQKWHEGFVLELREMMKRGRFMGKLLVENVCVKCANNAARKAICTNASSAIQFGGTH